MSSYVPKHLQFLDRSQTVDGWPEGITEVGKAFATERIQAGLAKYGQMDLSLAYNCIYEGFINKEPVPEELKSVLWDFLYAVTFRALLAVSAKQVWVAEKTHEKKRKTMKQWVTARVSRGDVEALQKAGQVTVGLVGQRVRDLATELAQQVEHERAIGKRSY